MVYIIYRSVFGHVFFLKKEIFNHAFLFADSHVVCVFRNNNTGCAAWYSWNDRLIYTQSKDIVLDPIIFETCDGEYIALVPVTFYVDMRSSEYNTVGGVETSFGGKK